MEHLLTVNQVAAILGIYHKKVQRLARTGVLPCIRVEDLPTAFESQP